MAKSLNSAATPRPTGPLLRLHQMSVHAHLAFCPAARGYRDGGLCRFRRTAQGTGKAWPRYAGNACTESGTGCAGQATLAAAGDGLDGAIRVQVFGSAWI
jgi:hypothetical protein